MNWQKYNLINTPELIKAVDDYLMNPDGTNRFPITSYDTETNGLYLYKTVIVGFSWSVNNYQGFYLPLLEWVPDPGSLKSITKEKVKMDVYKDGHFKCVWTGQTYPEDVTPAQYKAPNYIAALIKRWFGNTHLFMWNAPFDINHTFINFGVDLKNNLAIDGGLITHIANENESVGLKESAIVYREDLGINPFANADQEKRELKASVIKNGGNGKEVWRADLNWQAKYACADTFLTHGLIEVLLRRLSKEHGIEYSNIDSWIFDKEVMPVCKEVVVDMKRRGVYVDVAHFQKLFDQNAEKLIQLEDEFIKSVTPFLEGFDKGNSLDEAISNQRLVKTIIKMEGLKIPTLVDKKTGEGKDSISKAVVKKEYERNPHWIWGYILGTDEIKYSAEKLQKIKEELYHEVEGRRYRFNLNSNDHLIWLFFTKLNENKYKFPKTDGSTKEDWRPSIDADGIREHLLPKYPWLKSLLKYKKILKIQSTYVAPALELQINGWLYMDMKQNGTTSGRFSCSGGYNLQTLPRVDDELEALEMCDKCDSKDVELDEYMETMANRLCKKCGHLEHDIVRPSAIKKGFIAPPGYKIINADYSSLEPRCFAYVSGEDKIKQVYREGLDLYSKVYCDIFDKDKQYSAHPDAPNFLKKVYNKGRKFIKPLVLGIPYGAGDAQVANMTGNLIPAREADEHGIIQMRPNMEKGKEIRDLYLNEYPKLNGYMTAQEYMAVEYGFVASKYGRRRHFEYAKIIGDFIDQIPCLNNIYLDKMDKIYSFLESGKKRLQSVDVEIKHKQSGNKLFNLSEELLGRLADKLGMNLSVDKFGKNGIKQKGCWAYIRSLMKSDLNNAKNHPIQALAGHITNMGMLVANRLFKEHGIDGWVALQVHDEISCYAKISQADQAKSLLQKAMEENIYTIPLMNDVRMIAEPVICDNLKESK